MVQKLSVNNNFAFYNGFVLEAFKPNIGLVQVKEIAECQPNILKVNFIQ